MRRVIGEVVARHAVNEDVEPVAVGVEPRDDLVELGRIENQMIHDQPVVHEYPLVRTPTLFIMGANDHNAPGKPYTTPELGAGMGFNADNARRIAGTMANAKVIVFEGVGHMPHMERPAEFGDAMLSFLSRE